MNSMTERLRRWYEYEKDCNARVLQMLDSVPEEGRGNESFQKAIDKFTHAIVCRKLWMFRFGYVDSPPATLFPQGMEIDQLPELLDSVYSNWDQFMSGLTDEQVAGTFDYRATEGDHFRNTIEDILMHLQGHMMYHRGQVATLVANCGGTVVDTDFVFWARAAIPVPDTTG